MPDTEQPEGTHIVKVSGQALSDDKLMSKVADMFKAAEQPAKHREPYVRIVHCGGPARLTRVFVNGREAKTATRAEIVLDASHQYGVHARIEFVGRPPIESRDVHLDVAAEAAELVEAKPPQYFPAVLLGLIADVIPAGLAWWTWDLSGWFAGTVFVLSVIGGVAWTLGVLGAFVGFGRAMAAAERAYGQHASDAEPECEVEQ